jgi:hypothetical protein
MDRRTKAALNRTKATRLNEQWKVGAAQFRYSDDGHWYAALTRFPAALFDATGYLVFATEGEYRTSQHIRIGKQISVPTPGISGIPGYVRMLEKGIFEPGDIDIHESEATEGLSHLVLHLRRERNQTLVRRKKKLAGSLACEACWFSFSHVYGEHAAEYCEVHHLVPLAQAQQSMRTKMQDLAILCANCHRLVHLRNPPFALEEVRAMLSLARASTKAS